MARKETLLENIDVLHRNLTMLRDTIYWNRSGVSAGQEKFIMVYLEGIDEFIFKAIGIIDKDKYLEELKMLDE